MRRSLFFILLFFLSLPAWAEPIVTGILVQGNQMVEKGSILATVKTKVGQIFSATQIREDIKALYRMGSFEDIRVEKEETTNGVRLIFHVVERTNINRVVFEGNKKVKEEKLRELADIRTYRGVDAVALSSAIRKIQEHYQEEGFHLATIKTELRPDPQEKGKILAFVIRENTKVRIHRVSFIGNKAFSDRKLQKLLKSREKSRWSWLTSSGDYKEETIRRDIAFLTFHYQNHGYLKVKVEAPQIYLTRDRKWLTLTFHVEEGVPYTIRSVGIEGDILTTREELILKLETKPKLLYSRERLEKDLQLLSQLYGDQGYAYAAIRPVIDANDKDQTADVTFLIEKGKKVFIEKIHISGNTLTRDKVIRRELLLAENSLYNETRLQESKKRLEALGYFEEVNFATPRGSTDEAIYLNITVKEKPTGTFSIGAGYSTAESFTFQGSISKNNFFGYGVSGQASAAVSSRTQLFMVQATDPYFLDSQWILGVSGFRLVRILPDFDSRSFGGTFSLGHRIFDYSSLHLEYKFEDVDVGDFRTNVPARFNNTLSGQTSSGTLSLQRDTRNNRLFPTKGMFNVMSSEFAGIGGDSRFVMVTENFRYYIPLGKWIVWKTNLRIANAKSLSDDPVPLFERFFLGGSYSLRGFVLNSIGPSESGFVIGGTKMLQMNYELEVPIYGPAGIMAVSFVDAGQAYAEGEDLSLKNLRGNYGFGFRWNSPMGPLRFEWGIPFSPAANEDDVVFNFAIGSFF